MLYFQSDFFEFDEDRERASIAQPNKNERKRWHERHDPIPELSLSNIRKITSKLLLFLYNESATLVEPA